MKKYTTILMGALLLIATFLLSGCGSEKDTTLDTTQILNSIPEELLTFETNSPFSKHADVAEFIVTGTIEKRNTDEDTDTVYYVLQLENEYYHITRYLALYYTYYEEGGWLLDRWNNYQSQEIRVLASPFLFDDVNTTKRDSFTSRSFDEIIIDEEKNEVLYKYSYEIVRTYNKSIGNWYIKCTLDGNSWEVTDEYDRKDMLWNVVGTYSYEKMIYGKYELTLDIDSYNQTTGAMTGKIRAQAGKYWFEYPLTSSNVEISVDSNCIEISAPTKYAFAARSFVRIYSDNVDGCIRVNGAYQPCNLTKIG